MSEGGYIYHFPRVKLRKDKTNPRRLAYLYLLLFAVPPAWPVVVIGTLIALAGIVFHGWAAGYLARAGYEDRETVLTMRGPYRHNRNPYYVAHLVMDLGMFCLAGLAPLYLLYGPLMFLVYRRWVLNEEQFLRQEFGAEYDEMCQEVPRWFIRLTPATLRGPDQPFSWSVYRFNGEHWRSGSHLAWIALFWLYAALANPFAALHPLVPATIAAVITAYYLIHDVTPRDVSRVSYGWFAAAAVIAIAGAAVLLMAPVWHVWPWPWDWVGRLGGIVVGGVLVATVALRRATADDADAPEPFRSALVPWYLLGLAVALVFATAGAIWLVVVASLTLWALSIAGLASLSAPPRSLASAAVLAAIVLAAGAGSVALV